MRNFGRVAQGRSTQLLGCNTLFHGAPGTFGEVTQGRRTHSIYCYIIIFLAIALCLCNLHYSCFWVGWSAGHHSQVNGEGNVLKIPCEGLLKKCFKFLEDDEFVASVREGLINPAAYPNAYVSKSKKPRKFEIWAYGLPKWEERSSTWALSLRTVQSEKIG